MSAKKLFYPFSIFIGTIIGVGLFTLPYVTLKAGVITMLGYFILVGFLSTLIHLLFGEVVLRTEGIHHLPGYVHTYLGKKSKKAVLFSTLFELYGALLAYLIIGGEFLWGLANPILGGKKIIYILIFFFKVLFIIFAVCFALFIGLE